MSRAKAHVILSRGPIEPHLTDYSMMTDYSQPEFEERLSEMCGLYVDPPEKVMVVSLDEKTGSGPTWAVQLLGRLSLSRVLAAHSALLSLRGWPGRCMQSRIASRRRRAAPKFPGSKPRMVAFSTAPSPPPVQRSERAIQARSRYGSRSFRSCMRPR
jgi:hypothetical protein